MTHAEFIDALGGTGEVARRTGQKLNTVSMWKDRGIPWRWRHALVALAGEKAVSLPDHFLHPEAAA